MDTFSRRAVIPATNCIGHTAHSDVFAAVSIRFTARFFDHLVVLPGAACPGLFTKGLVAAGAFGFSFFGFLASLLPRWLLPLAIVCPSKLQRYNAGMARLGCGLFSHSVFDYQVVAAALAAPSSTARCRALETVVTGDPNISLAASKSSAVLIAVQFISVTSSA